MTDENGTKATPAWRLGRWAALAAALAGAAGVSAIGFIGCADHVQSTVVSCPCSQGICCESGVCAADQSSCQQATQALSSQSAGHWTGYIENAMFSSGSDVIDLVLHAEDDGSLSGHLTLGSGTPPAAPTDGTTAWPSEISILVSNPTFEGFAYHITTSSWTALRLKVKASDKEPWQPWCQLQHSYRVGDDWNCAPTSLTGGLIDDSIIFNDPNAGPDGGLFVRDPDGGATTAIDTGWIQMCVTSPIYCSCSANGCNAATSNSISLDVALNGNKADGSIVVGSLGLEANVHLIRASN